MSTAGSVHQMAVKLTRLGVCGLILRDLRRGSSQLDP
jgi:hypothetical protein